MSTPLDANRISVALAVSNADGTTVLPVKADPATHRLLLANAVTGSDLGGNPDPRNENRKVAFFAVSAVDGVTPVAIYCDSVTRKLLVRTT